MTEDVILRTVGIADGSPLAHVWEERREILRQSQASHDAVLTPREPGGLSTALRAALATRMSTMNGDATLAAHYREMLEADAGCTAELLSLCVPGRMPSVADAWLGAVVRHVDLLTLAPQDSSAPEIEALRAAGVGDDDIVRVTQLAGFVSYQVRVVAALCLLQGA